MTTKTQSTQCLYRYPGLNPSFLEAFFSRNDMQHCYKQNIQILDQYWLLSICFPSIWELLNSTAENALQVIRKRDHVIIFFFFCSSGVLTIHSFSYIFMWLCFRLLFPCFNLLSTKCINWTDFNYKKRKKKKNQKEEINPCLLGRFAQNNPWIIIVSVKHWFKMEIQEDSTITL